MRWILEHLQLVIFLVIIAAYVLKAMRAAKEQQRDAPPGGQRPQPGHDTEEAERTRQIQEEIRRRILARQRGEVAPPPIPPPAEVEREYELEEETAYAPRQPPAPPAAPPVTVEMRPAPEPAVGSNDAAILEAQRALEEQWRLVRRVREAASAGVPSLAPQHAAVAGTTRKSATNRALRADLAHRGSLRRALLLREILGEPVGLRTGPAGLPRR